jgi:hypothetical protein
MAEKVNYNLDFLIKYCSENNITLLRDYSKENNEDNKPKNKTGPKRRGINRDTIIEGTCGIDGCEESFKKSFRDLNEKNGYCRKHVVEYGNKKREETCLVKHNYTHVTQIPSVKNKIKNTNLKIRGVECSLQSNEVRDKGKKTMLQILGVENPSQSKHIIQLKKQNLLSKGEVKYTKSYLDELLKNNNAYTINEYDDITLRRESEIKFTCSCKNECTKIFRVIEKCGAFCEKCQDIHGKEKSIDTNMKNRGVPYNMQDPSVKEKVKSTNLERWGGHPMHNPKIADKCLKNSHKYKNYVFPSGRVDLIQGDEPYAINELLQNGIPEEDIITSRNIEHEFYYDKEGKSVKPVKKGEGSKYYPDIFIPSQNKIIEVKSTYTYEVDKEIVLLKQKAVKDAGYPCEIWIYDKNKEKIECIL